MAMVVKAKRFCSKNQKHANDKNNSTYTIQIDEGKPSSIEIHFILYYQIAVLDYHMFQINHP